jgi:hypothetical protein
MPTLKDVVEAGSYLDGTAPPADFLGARPQDGETVRINPPGFAWAPERGSVAFDLEVSPRPDFADGRTQRFSRLSLNLHALSEPLAAGKWYWRYRCHLEEGQGGAGSSRSGAVTSWSVTRSFTVEAGAPKVPIPPVAALKEQLRGVRPRLYARPETLDALRRRRETDARRWSALQATIEGKVAHPLMPEPLPYPNDEWNVDIWRDYMHQSRNMSSAVDHLGFGYLMTGERRWGKRLREWLCHLASWDPDGTSSYKYNDEVGMPALFTLARGYDCGYGALTEEERGTVRRALTRRAQEVYRMFREKNPYEVRPYDNHATRTINFLGQTALSLLGEEEQAEEWLDYVLKVYSAFYPPWGGDDGGYSQGPTYLCAYLNWMLQFLHTLENATGIDLHQKAFFRNVGYFILYAQPFFAQMIPFGDGTPGKPGRSSQLDMRRLAQKFREPTFQWWADQLSLGKSAVESAPEGLLEFLWHDETLVGRRPTDLPSSRCFFSVGEVAMHSDPTDAESDAYLLLWSSPFGAWSHGYADQNSFYLHAFGKALAISSGYYPWYGSPHHVQWTWQTKAHNSILVDGEGQVTGTRASRGKVEEFVTGEHFDYTRADATEGYGGRVTRFLRHVLYVRESGGPGWFVIADDLEARQPATFQWLLHALSQMTVVASKAEVTIAAEEAGLRVVMLAPRDLTFAQTDQFDPVPERDFRPQWHLTVSTRSPARSAGFLAVLEPFRAPGARRPDASARGRGRDELRYETPEAPGWLGCRVQLADTETLVGMRLAGGAGSAAGSPASSLAGVRTDARFFALRLRRGEAAAQALVVGGSFLEAPGARRVIRDANRGEGLLRG